MLILWTSIGCAGLQSACSALTKSWLDVQVDLELSGESERSEDINSESLLGPENWPLQVLNQQPRGLFALIQKLHSSESVHKAVTRGWDIPRLLDLIWSWMSPSGGDEDIFRPHGDPQMIRFGARLVLVLRHLLADEMKDAFKEKRMTLELVGFYASQLARHRFIDHFCPYDGVMLEWQFSSVHVRYKIFLFAVELPFPLEMTQMAVLKKERVCKEDPVSLETGTAIRTKLPQHGGANDPAQLLNDLVGDGITRSYQNHGHRGEKEIKKSGVNNEQFYVVDHICVL
ncbi:unnamed protein product [Lactuca saligna]|uniref:Uncharacterized protein n=1 Tax=Lactuca saligna TaxID=75948 RepID=A0AA36A4E4_LACSI|nr:unnamed protein product [Lactuca saligna]